MTVDRDKLRTKVQFVRTTVAQLEEIRAALWGVEEQATAVAYVRQPDSPDAAFDPVVWEAEAAANGSL